MEQLPATISMWDFLQTLNAARLPNVFSLRQPAPLAPSAFILNFTQAVSGNVLQLWKKNWAKGILGKKNPQNTKKPTKPPHFLFIPVMLLSGAEPRGTSVGSHQPEPCLLYSQGWGLCSVPPPATKPPAPTDLPPCPQVPAAEGSSFCCSLCHQTCSPPYQHRPLFWQLQWADEQKCCRMGFKRCPWAGSSFLGPEARAHSPAGEFSPKLLHSNNSNPKSQVGS